MPIVDSALSPYLSRNRRVTKPAVKSAGGIVVSQNRAASEIGARVLKAGGHAADAAVATAFALGIVEPWMSGIGGVGAALAFDAKSKKVTAFDFGGRSPKGLKTEDFRLKTAGTNRVDVALDQRPAEQIAIRTSSFEAEIFRSQPLWRASAEIESCDFSRFSVER